MLNETLEQLDAREILLEKQAVGMGIVRYRKEEPLPWREEHGKCRRETDMAPGKFLLRNALDALAKAIEKFLEEAKGGAGRRHTAAVYLEDCDPAQVAYLTAKGFLNEFKQLPTLQFLSLHIVNLLEVNREMELLQEKAPGMAVVLSRKLAVNIPQGHRRKLIRGAMSIAGVEPRVWTQADKLGVGAKLVELFIEVTGLAETVRKPIKKGRFVIVVQPTEECKDWLEREHGRCELLSPLLLPMVTEPVKWESTHGGGYLSPSLAFKPLIRTQDREYLAQVDHTPMPKVYAAINAVQETPWRINRNVLGVLREVWQNGGDIAGLPPREKQPLPPMPCAKEQVKQFQIKHPYLWQQWKTKRRFAHEANDRAVSERFAFMQQFWVAEKFEQEVAIYFPHQLDFRGRMYPMPCPLNPQADDVGKGLLEFAEGVELGEEGGYWLAIHLANQFGIDKVSFEDRLQWVLDHEQELLDSAVDPLGGSRFWQQADSPWQALAACFEWCKFKWHGDKAVSHIAVALDGSCSGLQHYSAVLRDEIGGVAVNLVPADKPHDVYAQVAVKVQEFVEQDSNPAAHPWRGGKVTRKIAKRPTMTYCYSATRRGMQNMLLQTMGELDEEGRRGGTGPYLGGADNFAAAQYLSHVMYWAIGQVVKAAQGAMTWLREATKEACASGSALEWTAPSGFPVQQAYWKSTRHCSNVWYGGRRLRLFLRSDGRKLDRKKMVSAVAPNWVHSLDASHLTHSVLLAGELGIEHFAVVHDSFGTHAANAGLFGEVLREAFVTQYAGDVLAEFGKHAGLNTLPVAPPRGSLELSRVRAAEYCFS